jgi:hypothetical protein
VSVDRFLETAAIKNSLTRMVRDNESIPTDYARLTVVTCFGDLRHLVVLSSFLLNRYKYDHQSKYLILVSYDGLADLFPYVNEFWGLRNFQSYQKSDGFENSSTELDSIRKSLFRDFFDEVISSKDEFGQLYYNGFTDNFFRKYNKFIRTTPKVSHISTLPGLVRNLTASEGVRVFFLPCLYERRYDRGKTFYERSDKEEYKSLLKALIEYKFVPIVVKNEFTHDISDVKGCIHLYQPDFGLILTTMRAAGLVLDYFSGVNRLAALAGVPFICLDDRQRYINSKEWEMDDLSCPLLAKKYLFSNHDRVKSIITTLLDLPPQSLLSADGECREVNYDQVRRKKGLMFGTNLLKVPREI